MSIRLNTHRSIVNTSSPSIHLHYGSKEDVSFRYLFNFFRRAFPFAFNRETFQRVYEASDISKIAYQTISCCSLKIYGAILATSIFDLNQERKLKILMLVEDDKSSYGYNLGKRLLTQIIDTCKEFESILDIHAFVEASNQDGIDFYRMMGFKQCEILKNYFPIRASFMPDAIKFEYPIRMSVAGELIDQNKSITNKESPSSELTSSSEMSDRSILTNNQ